MNLNRPLTVLLTLACTLSAVPANGMLRSAAVKLTRAAAPKIATTIALRTMPNRNSKASQFMAITSTTNKGIKQPECGGRWYPIESKKPEAYVLEFFREQLQEDCCLNPKVDIQQKLAEAISHSTSATQLTTTVIKLLTASFFADADGENRDFVLTSLGHLTNAIVNMGRITTIPIEKITNGAHQTMGVIVITDKGINNRQNLEAQHDCLTLMLGGINVILDALEQQARPILKTYPEEEFAELVSSLHRETRATTVKILQGLKEACTATQEQIVRQIKYA
jgi:hypothetical protein